MHSVTARLPWYKTIESQSEALVIGIFTIEYSLRLLVHEGSSRLTFLMTPMNAIDLLAILPFYLELVLGASGGGVLRVLRIVRLLRLFRHSQQVVCLLRLGSLYTTNLHLIRKPYDWPVVHSKLHSKLKVGFQNESDSCSAACCLRSRISSLA